MAAQGYFELGMFEDAANELESLDPEQRGSPRVIAFRVAIYSALKRWTLAEVAARHMVKVDPDQVTWWIQWAYATRRCRSIDEAKAILLDGEVRHPKEALIKYNLGCYACQLGDLEEARARVAAAIALDGKFRAMALDEPDLEPLWKDIAKGLPLNSSSP